MSEMSPENFERWQQLIESVDKTKIPIEFIKKIVIKLPGRKQKTINIQTLIRQGFDSDEIEQAISRKLDEYEEDFISLDFILNIEGIAEIVQHDTDEIFNKTK